MTHTLYRHLQDRGFSEKHLAEQDRQSTAPGTLSFALRETLDEEPIAGLGYQTDYRTEEENGLGELAQAFARAERQEEHVQVTEELILLTTRRQRRIHNLQRRLDLGAQHLAEPWHVAAKLSRIPVWFSTGDVLVVPRKRDALLDACLDYLVTEAREHNALALVNISGPFSTGAHIHSLRDIGPLQTAHMEAESREYVRRMDLLAPVRQELEERGHGFYFLGKPKTLRRKGDEDPVDAYWLNGMAGKAPHTHPQPYGWYTLEELLAEVFVEDALSRREEASG